jgi:hypothetical protein
MKKVILYFVLASGIFSFMSCAKGVIANDAAINDLPCDCSASYTPTATSLAIKNETKKMSWSHIDKIASSETDDLSYYFIIRENKTFSVIVSVHGTQQYDFRAGTFQANGDTLSLKYYKNVKSDYLNDKVVVDNDKKEVSFLGTEQDKNKSLKILNHVPRALIAMLFKESSKNNGVASINVSSPFSVAASSR